VPIDVRAGLRRALRPGRSPWTVLVPVVCLLAGFGFAAAARDSRGTEIRSPQTGNLAGLVRSAEADVQAADAQVERLQAQVSAATKDAGSKDARVAAAQAAAAQYLDPGGRSAMQGPGITVVLDDAPADPANDGVDPNQLVVHQSDLQAVVNALWAGGAEAMTIAGQRVIATSAVRCVGNTLLLNGDVYSPPFRVAAIGPYRTMQKLLDASQGVKNFKEAASFYGLGYTVGQEDRLELPAYKGPIGLTYARARAK
jgi:uncharacterized protein YlxW (UPF0749 family)